MKFWCWVHQSTTHMSPPSRGAWIEIGENERSWTASGGGVAPLAGGVD